MAQQHSLEWWSLREWYWKSCFEGPNGRTSPNVRAMMSGPFTGPYTSPRDISTCSLRSIRNCSGMRRFPLSSRSRNPAAPRCDSGV